MYEVLKTFYDGRKVADGEEIDCDVCLIGGGAAGITIARELANQDLKVLILESGGLNYDDASEELGKLVVAGHQYPEEGSRLRFFGGATNHWGGHCVPLRRSIFGKRDWIPDGEWPFDFNELEPYYIRAHDVLEIGPYSYAPVPVAKRLNKPLLPFRPDRVETVLSRYRRQLFGSRYRDDLDRAENINVFLYATVSSLRVSDDARTVTSVTVKTSPDKSFSVRPRIAVLTSGGIENARLLLLSNDQVAAGIGNEHDLVGRYFADHVWYTSGFILPIDQDPKAVELYADEIPFEGDYGVRCHLALPERLNQELRIPDYRTELSVRTTYGFHEATVSTKRLTRYVRALDPKYVTAEDIMNIVNDPLAPIRFNIDQDKGPLVYGFNNSVETVPNPESLVRLSTERDALGMNRPELRWQLSNLDKEGIAKAQGVIAAEVGRSGVGRMNIFIPSSEETILETAIGESHHMGTTRMHAHPEHGVVDANSRVHSVENLFIAGSSIFPSYGYSNPTFSIVALSIRLADHIKTFFRGAK